MHKLLSTCSTLILLVAFVLSSYALNSQAYVAQADPSAVNVVNAQAINSAGQRNLFFVRGVDSVGFDITIANSCQSKVTGTIIVTIQDVNGVPVETVSLSNFTINPSATNNTELFGTTIPSYAYVGIATAQIDFVDPQTYVALSPSLNAKFYIGYVSNPPNPFSFIDVTPSLMSTVAGNSVNYDAVAYDSIGNSIDIAYFANWDISAGAGGSWSANTYSAAIAGIWNVTASLGSQSAVATLNVTHASAVNLSLSPQNPNITAGQNQLLNARAYDFYGNAWDVTNSIVWNIDSGAGGYWTDNSYTAAKAGTWTITGTLINLSSSTTLNVTHASAHNISITPQLASINAGCSQIFESTAFDLYNNSWDVSTLASWSINSSASGYWSASKLYFR